MEIETTFELKLKSITISAEQNMVIGDPISGYKLIDGQKLDCSNLCDELDQLLENEDEVMGIFTHSAPDKIKLLALESE